MVDTLAPLVSKSASSFGNRDLSLAFSDALNQRSQRSERLLSYLSIMDRTLQARRLDGSAGGTAGLLRATTSGGKIPHFLVFLSL